MFKNEITFDRFMRWVIVAAIVFAVLYGLNYLSAALLPFFIAWFLAYLLFPMVKFIERVLHIKVRTLSILLTLAIVISVITVVVMLVIPPMIEQFQKLGAIVTNYIHHTANITDIPEALNTIIQENEASIERFFRSKDFSELIKHVAPSLLNVVTETFTVIYSIIASCIVLLYLFFILLDYEYLAKNWVRIFPKEDRTFWQSVLKDVENAMNNYVRGQSLVSLIMAIMFAILFTIIDFPMAIGLGILIGIMNLVPYLHTFALIPTCILALLKAADTGESFWIIFLSAFIVFCIVQVINDMFVVPKVMGKAMGMNPAILLLSLSVWGSLLGFIGLIIALPLTTLIMSYWQRYITKDKETKSIVVPEREKVAEEKKTEEE